MNFIKTSKFSVKGIDTTRYIPNEVRNLRCFSFLVEFRKDFSFFVWSRKMGLFPPPLVKEGLSTSSNKNPLKSEARFQTVGYRVDLSELEFISQSL
jgi:hypothetical protein